MVNHQYSEEVQQYVNEFNRYHFSDTAKALEVCLQIIDSFPEDDSALAFAHYYAAEMLHNLSRLQEAVDHIEKSKKYALSSGNIRYLLASIMLTGTLHLRNGNELAAAEHFFEAMSQSLKYHANDIMSMLYINIGSLYYDTEDWETALDYYQRGYQAFLDHYKEKAADFASITGSQLASCCMCYIKLKRPKDLADTLKLLEEMKFAELSPTYHAIYLPMQGWYYALIGDRTRAKEYFYQFLELLPQLDAMLDLFLMLPELYDFFNAEDEEEDRFMIMKLMQDIADRLQSVECQDALTRTKLKHLKSHPDDKALLATYQEYYDWQNKYAGNLLAQRRANLDLRSRMHEELERRQAKMDEQQAELAKLHTISEQDALTELPNRYALTNYVRHTLEQAKQNQLSLGVVLMDIDNYKSYNDYYGHLQGDDCLKRIAEQLTLTLRHHFVSRYGGDEFVFLFYSCTTEKIILRCQEIQQAIAKLALPYSTEANSGCVTVSLGITNRVPQPEDDFSTFLHEADTAMYEGKQAGKNAIHVYQPL